MGGSVPGYGLGAAALAAVLAGTDEGAIIDVVTKRSNAQRQQIIKAYKAHYGRVLLAPLPPHRPRPSRSNLLPSLKEILLGTWWAALLCPITTSPWQKEVFRAASHLGCTSSPGEHPFPFVFPRPGGLQSQHVPKPLLNVTLSSPKVSPEASPLPALSLLSPRSVPAKDRGCETPECLCRT